MGYIDPALEIPAPPPASKDRPAETFKPRAKREMTILIVARLLFADAGEQLCRIRNISSGGMMLETSTQLEPGDKIGVQLRDLGALHGEVVWTRLSRAGVRLDQPTDISELLQVIHGTLNSNGRVVRPPRMSAQCRATISSLRGSAPAMVLDVSQRGAKLNAEGLKAHDQVMLHIPGLSPREAVVRWARGTEAGIVFFETLAYRQLDSWLQDGNIRYAARATHT